MAGLVAVVVHIAAEQVAAHTIEPVAALAVHTAVAAADMAVASAAGKAADIVGAVPAA